MSLPTAHPVSRHPSGLVVLKEAIAGAGSSVINGSGCVSMAAKVRLGLALNFSVFLHEVLKDELQQLHPCHIEVGP